MGPVLVIVLVGFAIILLVVMWAIGIYNSLQRQRLTVDTAFADIDTLLKRRCDLIPNLVETVKGYAGHEKSTLEGVMRARAAAMGARDSAERMKAEGEISGFLSRLMAVSEAYPDLKANQNFMQLQGELGSTEDGIARARGGFNGTVRTYNETLSVFPSNLVGRMLGFAPRAFFEAPTADRDAPKVSF
ncbi:MAG: LemA family protein [Planctomycetota bacterium]|nr:LemA family protein [Planctomycetota bacterium]